jgi:lysophospholipase L1-like esterase
MRMTRTKRQGFLVAAMVFAGLSAPRALEAGQVYLSLGDSVAFGEQTFSDDPSFGDRGFVKLYADFLATQAGGVRPTVVNLAIAGETSTSFSSGAGRVGPGPGFSDDLLASLNLNYDAFNPFPTQQALLISTILAAHAAGNMIGPVTISLGADDLFSLVLSPAFNAPGADQAGLLTQALTTFAQNEGMLVGLVKALAPEANIFLLSSYNPFPGDPSNPFNQVALPAINGLNGAIHGVADYLKVHYVDLYTPFFGHESAYTYIADPNYNGNVHPNSLGYSVIVAQIQAVPEPSTIVMAFTGAIGLAFAGRRLRTRSAA